MCRLYCGKRIRIERVADISSVRNSEMHLAEPKRVGNHVHLDDLAVSECASNHDA